MYSLSNIYLRSVCSISASNTSNLRDFLNEHFFSSISFLSSSLHTQKKKKIIRSILFLFISYLIITLIIRLVIEDIETKYYFLLLKSYYKDNCFVFRFFFFSLLKIYVNFEHFNFDLLIKFFLTSNYSWRRKVRTNVFFLNKWYQYKNKYKWCITNFVANFQILFSPISKFNSLLADLFYYLLINSVTRTNTFVQHFSSKSFVK